MAKEKNTADAKPPYLMLADKLRKAIAARNIAPGSFMGTEVELSKNHSLARMTVRRAVQTLIDEGILERLPGRGIFVRNPEHQTRSVKVLAGNLCWTPAVNMARAAKKVADDKGVELILCDAHGNMAADLETIRRLPYNGVRGALIMSLHCREFHSALSHLVAANFPFVVVDQHLHEIDAPSVCSDNFGGGALAASAVLEAGHRRIAFIGDLGATTTADRLRGVQGALARDGVTLAAAIDLQVLDQFGDWEPRVKETVRELMASPAAPTAVLCSCDSVARAAYRTLLGLGLEIPRDVSVVGFDDDPLAQWLDPPLSTIRQNFDDIGRVAMEKLIERMANSEAPAEPVHIPVDYIARGSVAAPTSSKAKIHLTA
jgi:DNA-binding LacI/PurR family transcriptional regulator